MPSISEERAGTVAARLGLPSSSPWRTNGPILALVFFFLTCLGVAAFGLLIRSGLTVGIAAIALAEFLIVRRRFFGTGVESALWISGLFALITALPSSGRPEAILVFAAAAAIAGLRVRNPYFGAMAVILGLSYFGVKLWWNALIAAALIVAVIALIGVAMEWKRPSTEMLWIAVLLVAPVTAAGWTVERTGRAWALGYAAFALAALLAGVRLRHHAPLIAAFIAIVIAVIEADLPIAVEWQLMIGGLVLFGVSAMLGRALRGNERGFVVTPSSLTPFDDALETAGTLALQPRVEANAPPETRGDGGSFGGAGSTGEF